MTVVPIFTGTVRDGQLKLDEKPLFMNHLKSLEGKRIQLTVQKQVNRRSTQQNRYLWGVVYKLIAQATGHTAEELHSAFKYMYSPKAVVGSLVVPKSTRTHDTIEMTEYIEKIRAFAAETLSLSIPDPNEVTT